MTRKDYILLAQALKDAMPDDPHCTVAGSAAKHGVHAQCCKSIAHALARHNSRFDFERFIKACGLPS